MAFTQQNGDKTGYIFYYLNVELISIFLFKTKKKHIY